MFLNQIPGMQQVPREFQGILRVSASGPISVLALRGHYNERGDLLITTTSPVAETAAPAAGERFFAHLVDSGGYTTQFILYSAYPEQSVSGAVRYFGQGGGTSEFETAMMNRREFLAAVTALGVRQAVVIPHDELTPVTLIRQPYIQNTREDGTSILWAARDPADGVIRYSSDGFTFKPVQAGVRIFSPAETGGLPEFTQFRADLTALAPGTDYVYQLYIDSQFIREGRFRTGDGPFSFLVFGDTGQLHAGSAVVLRAGLRENRHHFCCTLETLRIFPVHIESSRQIISMCTETYFRYCRIFRVREITSM